MLDPRAFLRLIAVLSILCVPAASCLPSPVSGNNDPAEDSGGPTDSGADVSEDSTEPVDTTDDSSTDSGQAADTDAPDTTSDTGSPVDTSASDTDGAGADADQGLPDGPSSERQTRIPRVSGDADAPPNGYWEYLPPGYGDGEPRPLLVFWHGLGENGNGDGDLDKVLRNGPPKYINADNWPSSRPFVVLSPQHSGGGCPSADEIHDFFDYAVAEYDVDPTRIYLTGLSCGAIGSWNYLGKYTDELVSAAVLISGDGRGAWNRTGCNLGLVAIWGFHGDQDGTVSPQGTIVPTDELANCPAPPRLEVKQTIYEGVGHNAWSRTYSLNAGHQIYQWLLGFESP